jgi:hypothetical protein
VGKKILHIQIDMAALHQKQKSLLNTDHSGELSNGTIRRFAPVSQSGNLGPTKKMEADTPVDGLDIVDRMSV